MDVTLAADGDVRQGAVDALSESREGARSVLGDVASKAQTLSGQAAERALQVAQNRRKVRRKYRRTAKKQTRKLERRLEKTARRLQISTPIGERRLHRRRPCRWSGGGGAGRGCPGWCGRGGRCRFPRGTSRWTRRNGAPVSRFGCSPTSRDAGRIRPPNEWSSTSPCSAPICST